MTYPYVKSTEVFHCPNDPTEQTRNLNGRNEIDYPVSYAFNANLDGHDSQSNRNPGATVASLTAPVYTVMLVEVEGAQCEVNNVDTDAFSAHPSPVANGGDGGSGWVDFTPGTKYAVSSGTGKTMGQPTRIMGNQFTLSKSRHTQGGNFALSDGHVKYLRPEQVSPGTWNANENCDQSAGDASCSAGSDSRAAAGTGFVSGGTKKFVATFSPR